MRKGTLSLSWGAYGGFYVTRWRVCLGWVAATFTPGVEIDALMWRYVTDEAVSPEVLDGVEVLFRRARSHRPSHELVDVAVFLCAHGRNLG